MKTRLTVSGHPIQPLLLMIPLGLFFCATGFDLFAVGTGLDIAGEVGFWTGVAALVAAAPAVLAGLIDLWTLPRGPLRHLAGRISLANAATVGLFLGVCLLRARLLGRAASGLLVPVEVLALAAGVCAAWFGVRLVRRLYQTRDEPPAPLTLRPVVAAVRLPMPRTSIWTATAGLRADATR